MPRSNRSNRRTILSLKSQMKGPTRGDSTSGSGSRWYRLFALIFAATLLALCLVAVGAEASHLIGNRAYSGIAPVCRVETSARVVALSFDDGPDPAYTPELLKLLESNAGRATFFLIGRHAEASPQLVEQELHAGMEVGNHTWSHPHLTDLSFQDAIAEIDRASDFLASISAPSSLFRAPYGEISANTLQAIEDQTTLVPIHWSVPVDKYLEGEGLKPEAAAQALASEIRPGDIVLAHDASDGGMDRESTVATMRLLLPLLATRGFRVLTVSDLLGRGTPVRAEPRTWFWQSGFECPKS